MGKVVKKLVKASTFGAVDLDPDVPRPKKPAEAPDPDNEEAARAEQRRQQRRRRTGRTSTVLSGESSLG